MFLTLRVPVALVAAGVAAAASPFDAELTLVVLAAVVAVLVASDVVLAPRPATLRPTRAAPPVLSVDGTGRLALTLRNPRSRRVSVEARDASPPSLRRAPLLHRVSIAADAAATLEATVAPTRRGLATVGPLTIRTAGPLGLAGRQRTLPLVERIKVYPALSSRAEVELRLERARLLQFGERSTSLRGGGTNFDSLREYHPDDEFRRINWRATARASKPISNVYREERNQQVLLLLDASRAMAGTVRGLPRFDHALDAAFAVGELAARVGDHVGMVAFADDVVSFLPPRSGRSQPRRVLDSLFDLHPSLVAANYLRAFSLLLGRHRRRALLVLLTELTDEAVMEPLFSALRPVLTRHLVLVGSLLDPQLDAVATSIPSSSEEAFAKAAAAEAVMARSRAAARLTAMGVDVVDRPPGALAAAVADHYLRIKAVGRL